MAGNKTMDDAQLVLRFNSNKEGFDAEAFKKMPKVDQQALATKILEDAGCIVLQNEDFSTEETPVEIAPILESKEEIKVKKETPSIQEVKIIDNGDDFAIFIPEQPIKVSTAKRI